MKIKYRMMIATVILLTVITSTALAHSGENNACNGCHAYPSQSTGNGNENSKKSEKVTGNTNGNGKKKDSNTVRTNNKG